MSALLDVLEKKDSSTDYSLYKRRYLKDKDVYKLELIQMDNEFFKTYIIGDNPVEEEFMRTPSQKRLYYAKKFFKRELSKLDVNVLKEYKEKVERTKLLTYSVNDTAEATLIFETTNDRGKTLTKIKNKRHLIFIDSR